MCFRGESVESKILRDRLYRSKASANCLAAMGGVAPEFPFSLADVKKTRVQKSTQPQQTYQKQEAYQSHTSSSAAYSQAQQSASVSAAAVQSQQVSNISLSSFAVYRTKSQAPCSLQQVPYQLAGVRTKIRLVDALITTIKRREKLPGNCQQLLRYQRQHPSLYHSLSRSSKQLLLPLVVLLPLVPRSLLRSMGMDLSRLHPIQN